MGGDGEGVFNSTDGGVVFYMKYSMGSLAGPLTLVPCGKRIIRGESWGQKGRFLGGLLNRVL